MNILKQLNGKSVFVTGHTGFKGTWLCQWLERLGAQVTGYALEPPTEPSNFEVSRVRDVLHAHHIGDIRDLDMLKNAIAGCKPDLIMHLAAQSIVRDSYKDPQGTFDVNLMGTVNVLESVRTLGHSCSIVCVTSDKCYRNVEQVWGYREIDAMGEHDPYGGSKGAAELAIRSYTHSFFNPEKIDSHGVKLASARAGNVVGGGDWTKDALIVDIVKSLAADKVVEIRSPDAFRPWQHVLQALSGYLLLSARLLASDNPRYCSGWNFGPVAGNELPVRKIVELFLKEWNDGSWNDASNTANPHEAGMLRLSIDKAMAELGWRPGWNVEKVLQRTASWYKTYFATPDAMHEYSLTQIIEYEEQFLKSIQD